MTGERILQEAALDPSAVTYRVIGGALGVAATVVGIPLLLVVVPVMQWYWRRHYANLRVILTSRDMKVHRGILNREEKAIPLEKITDLAVFQGPLMRRFGLKGIRVETAGQSSGAGALVTVIGIENTDAFRDLVLRQRDRIADADAEVRGTVPAASPAASALADGEVLAALRSIDATLRRIEHELGRRDDAPIA